MKSLIFFISQLFLIPLFSFALLTNKLFLSRRCVGVARAKTFKLFGAQIGHNVLFQTKVSISGIKNLNIGDGVFIGEKVKFICYGSKINIGEDTIVARECTFITRNHNYDKKGPIKNQGYTEEAINVGKDVWIGLKCTILPGASIGDGAIIAAHSVVTGDVDPGCIYAGIPAKKIKTRWP